MGKGVVFTVFEGDHVIGVATLVNSLVRSGFQGIVYAGYRDALQGWAKNAIDRGQYLEVAVCEGLTIRLIKLEGRWHLAHQKPSFILNVLKEYELDADSMFYFDSDVVVKGPWHLFEEWANCGVALCLETSLLIMPPSHPRRRAWERLGAKIGLHTRRDLNHYINSGFIGVHRDRIEVLRQWQQILEALDGEGIDQTKFQTLPSYSPWFATDQDALNLVAMSTDQEVSIVGPDGMDFWPPGYYMAHCLGPKPWRGGILRQSIRGFPPNAGGREWIRHLDGPIKPLSRAKVWKVRLETKIALAIGRFYRRHRL